MRVLLLHCVLLALTQSGRLLEVGACSRLGAYSKWALVRGGRLLKVGACSRLGAYSKWALVRGWALTQSGRLLEVGTYSRLGTCSNKYGICQLSNASTYVFTPIYM